MKPGDLGLRVTAVEILGVFVPGTLALWALVHLGVPAIAAPQTVPKGLDTAAGLAAIVVLGAILKEAGHLLNPFYDRHYKVRFPRLKALSDSVRQAGTMDPEVSAYAQAMNALRQGGVATVSVELDEGMGKLFRGLAVGLVLLVPVLAARDQLAASAIALAVALGAAGLSFHLRLKASESLYRAYLSMASRDSAASS